MLKNRHRICPRRTGCCAGPSMRPRGRLAAIQAPQIANKGVHLLPESDMQLEDGLLALVTYPAHAVHPRQRREGEDRAEYVVQQLACLRVCLALEQCEEDLVEDVLVIVAESVEGMCRLDCPVNIAAVQAALDPGQGVLEPLPGGPDADVEAVVADGEDEVLRVDAELLKHVPCVP